MSSVIGRARSQFHQAAVERLLRLRKGVPNLSDKKSVLSRELGFAIFEQLTEDPSSESLAGQTSGTILEELTEQFLRETFLELDCLRPGRWRLARGAAVSQFEQYSHLAVLDRMADESDTLKTVLGSDYVIKPDVVLWRLPEPDDAINSSKGLVDDSSSHGTSIRATNNAEPIMHASISCKYTMRSDRAQNSRSEALNLMRNRKGRTPHIVVVTAEPTPNRLASITLGTGDIDCVYHFALYELRRALESSRFVDARESFDMMVEGKRLRDISDLPLDLAV